MNTLGRSLYVIALILGLIMIPFFIRYLGDCGKKGPVKWSDLIIGDIFAVIPILNVVFVISSCILLLIRVAYYLKNKFFGNRSLIEWLNSPVIKPKNESETEEKSTWASWW